MLIDELLGTKYPIFQEAMANIATPEFVAAISNCDILSIIATDAIDEHQMRGAIRTCKRLTDKSFGINVILMNPHTQIIMQVICEERVAVVIIGTGNPGPYTPALEESGCKMIPVVASMALTHHLKKSGVDAVIAEGGGSGGHVGETTTMSLVPQVVGAVLVPVLAAGGIANGQRLNAALCLGAVGVQIGTRLLLAEECPIRENYKRAVMKVKGMDSTIASRSTGAPVCILKNQMALQYLKLEQNRADKEEMEKLILDGL